MKILSVGNIYESCSILVSEFCKIDSEVIANEVTSRISGAAIVVSAIAAYLKMKPTLLSKVKSTERINEFIELLSNKGIDTTTININSNEINTLLTVYNSKLERICYSYSPNKITSSDLLEFDFSDFDATFFCCIPFDDLENVFKSNKSIKKTKSIILASGFTNTYYNNTKFRVKPDFIFMNRGELFKLFDDDWTGDNNKLYEYCKKLDDACVSTIITMGKDGIIVKCNSSIQTIPVNKVDKIMHPGGAGDAFAVGFINGFLCKKPIDRCCKIGHACAQKMLQVNNTKDFLETLRG